ncbi:MAG: IS110 family transposase, partial [Colwellia sp.]|nr:IS110 family transposase [Colwellia sp.]
MTKFSVYIGIDWANDKHDVCVQVGNSSTRKFEVIKHSPKSINEW